MALQKMRKETRDKSRDKAGWKATLRDARRNKAKRQSFESAQE